MSGFIDLNADLGEGMPGEAGLMELVSSCNIACGGHAGDEGTMRAALRLARAHGVAAGAHPSYPDRAHFGRRVLDLPATALADALADQIASLANIAEGEGVVIRHVKPHGALYNLAARRADLASLIAGVVASAQPGARLVGPPASALEAAARDHGLGFIGEGFADRAYEDDASLKDRSLPGALIEELSAGAAQALSIALDRRVRTASGKWIALPAVSLCLHGDTPGALGRARHIRGALEAAGVAIAAP